VRQWLLPLRRTPAELLADVPVATDASYSFYLLLSTAGQFCGADALEFSILAGIPICCASADGRCITQTRLRCTSVPAGPEEILHRQAFHGVFKPLLSCRADPDGSESAGASLEGSAGKQLKKNSFELGEADPRLCCQVLIWMQLWQQL